MEFDLIQRWFEMPFAPLSSASGHVHLGIGDDCAILEVPPGHRLVTSTDLLCQGRHFFSDTCPSLVGWKSLAVNLSDLAAMGANPLGFSLGLSIGQVNEDWLGTFSAGLLEIANKYQCPLIGGDTTGADNPDQLLVSITVFGSLPSGFPGLKRTGAQAGDDIWVSGLPGKARLGLLAEFESRKLLHQELSTEDCELFGQVWGLLNSDLQQQCLDALHKPIPQLALGNELLPFSRCAIDLSDGLAGDLQHVSKASQLKAQLFEDALDSLWMAWAPCLTDHLPFLRKVSLMGGDDYQLCFTLPSNMAGSVEELSMRSGIRLAKVGQMRLGTGIELLNAQGVVEMKARSFDHFQTNNWRPTE